MNAKCPRRTSISVPATGALILWLIWPIGATAQQAPPTPTAYERNWRDHLAPWQDPATTEPERLHRPVAIPLPPDLRTSSAPPLDGACAHRHSTHTEHGAWALQRLHADAGSAHPPTLGLSTAIALALCHNPQTRATWSTIAQQAAQLGQTQSAYWPQLQAGMARQRSRARYPDSPLPATTTWATSQHAILSWRLWDFGARDAKTHAAQAQLSAALHTQDATIHQTLTDVLRAYGQAQAAQASLATQSALLPLAERSVQAAQRRQQGGAGSGNDTLQAQTAHARIQLEHSRVQGELHTATAQLVYLLGLPAGTALQLPTPAPLASSSHAHPTRTDTGAASSPPEHQLLTQALDDWLQQARHNHPAILAAKAQWHAARANLRAVQSEGLPTLDLSLAHYRNGRPNTSITASHSRENVLSLTLSIPLFDGFNTTYKIRAAQAQAEHSAIQYQATEQQTLQELVQWHAQAKASLNNLHMAQTLYQLASQAAQSTQRQYDQGAADIVQLNQSLGNLQQAQLELAQSQADWNRARLQLWLQHSAITHGPR